MGRVAFGWARRGLRTLLGVAVSVIPAACAGAPSKTTSPSAVPSLAVPSHVRWRPWSREAFEEARKQNKLLLVSVQTQWCHWCHVMNETTYRDPDVLRLLDAHFVAIRVDADARPDVAERYARWAWPATALLSPQAEPVLELRGHRPRARFARTLRKLVAALARGEPLGRQTEPEAVEDSALSDLASLRDRVRMQLDEAYDPREGGWGRPQKYPLDAPVEHAFWRSATRRGGEREPLPADDWRKRAFATLEGHRQLIDPVWGGMYQYSLRGVWDHPHYEKIAPIQAGAIRNFARAYGESRDAKWLAAGRRVQGYVLEFLTAPEGGFYTSQDADVGTIGEPGFRSGHDYYGLDAEGRRRAGIPRVDTNVYANWNGSLIAAMAMLYAATLDRAYLDPAVKAAQRLIETHGVRGGFAHGARRVTDSRWFLADQVHMARGFLGLYEVTGDLAWLDRVEQAVRFMDRELWDANAGGYFAHTRDPEAVGIFAERRKPLEDNGVAVQVLLRLARLRPEETSTKERAAATLRSVASMGVLRTQGRKVGEFLLALEKFLGPYVILSVVGPEDDAATQALHRAALQWSHPARMVELGRPGRSRYPYPGRPAVYVCSESACSLPVTDPAKVSAAAASFFEAS